MSIGPQCLGFSSNFLMVVSDEEAQGAQASSSYCGGSFNQLIWFMWVYLTLWGTSSSIGTIDKPFDYSQWHLLNFLVFSFFFFFSRPRHWAASVLAPPTEARLRTRSDLFLDLAIFLYVWVCFLVSIVNERLAWKISTKELQNRLCGRGDEHWSCFTTQTSRHMFFLQKTNCSK